MPMSLNKTTPIKKELLGDKDGRYEHARKFMQMRKVIQLQNDIVGAAARRVLAQDEELEHARSRSFGRENQELQTADCPVAQQKNGPTNQAVILVYTGSGRFLESASSASCMNVVSKWALTYQRPSYLLLKQP